MPLKYIKAVLAISLCLLGGVFFIGKWKENEEMNCCAGAAGELVLRYQVPFCLPTHPELSHRGFSLCFYFCSGCWLCWSPSQPPSTHTPSPLPTLWACLGTEPDFVSISALPSVPTFPSEPLHGPHLSESLFLANARHLKTEYGNGILELFFPQAPCIHLSIP